MHVLCSHAFSPGTLASFQTPHRKITPKSVDMNTGPDATVLTTTLPCWFHQLSFFLNEMPLFHIYTHNVVSLSSQIMLKILPSCSMVLFTLNKAGLKVFARLAQAQHYMTSEWCATKIACKVNWEINRKEKMIHRAWNVSVLIKLASWKPVKEATITDKRLWNADFQTGCLRGNRWQP